MNVVILNTAELTGGAAVAANRLMKALNRSGANVSMLVRDQKAEIQELFRSIILT